MENMELSDTVLFVDDERNILSSIRRGLINEPYIKLFANSGKEALEIMEDKNIAVLVTDMRMPGMSGMELLKIVQEKYPDVVRIILTGYSQISTLISAINSGQVYRYLTKPWKLEADYIPSIRQAIEYHQINAERKIVIKKLKSKNIELNRRNFEIKTLLKQIEKSNAQKTVIITHLTKEIIPFISEVVKSTGEITEGVGYKSIIQFKNDLKELNDRGIKIFDLLKKVEKLLLSKSGNNEKKNK
jgi:DNA-binding NtrC family response regulator